MIPFRRDTVSESSVASMSFDAQRGLFEAKVKYIDSLGMDKKADANIRRRTGDALKNEHGYHRSEVAEGGNHDPGSQADGED
jgi:hypothetical protein